MDVTPFSGASQRINKETEQKEHKTLGTSSILEGTPQNHRVSECRVLREATETRGLWGSSVVAPADWGVGCSAPEPEDPASPPASHHQGQESGSSTVPPAGAQRR